MTAPNLPSAAESDSASTVPKVTVLDNRRTPCAVGLIRATGVMAGVPAGDVLEIHTRDRFAPAEIPLWATRSGHPEPTVRREGSWPFGYWVFSVVAGGDHSAT